MQSTSHFVVSDAWSDHEFGLVRVFGSFLTNLTPLCTLYFFTINEMVYGKNCFFIIFMEGYEELEAIFQDFDWEHVLRLVRFRKSEHLCRFIFQNHQISVVSRNIYTTALTDRQLWRIPLQIVSLNIMRLQKGGILILFAFDDLHFTAADIRINRIVKTSRYAAVGLTVNGLYSWGMKR